MTRNHPIELALQAAERLLDVQITLHDLTGLFHSPDGGAVLGVRRQSHRRGAVCARAPRERCIAHCRLRVNARAARAAGPFEHTCFNGVREIVVPVRQEGLHVATLFAGPFAPARPRRGKPPCPALPALHADRAASLKRVLFTLGEGLIARLDRLSRTQETPSTRKGQILRFVRMHAHERVALADLAAELHLSESRTSHVVSGALGRPFQEALKQERIKRARVLLASTDLPIKQICGRVGLDNPSYFSRLFRKATGLAPRQFRRRQSRDR